MLRIPYADLEAALASALLPHGFSSDRAQLCARLFAETTRDGVYTHGLARFPRFLATIQTGAIVPTAAPTLLSAFGSLERWTGNSGPGNLNAYASMARAIELARIHGIGLVALSNTTHWLRGGSYGWQAADKGLFALCFTNTFANLPAWGTTAPSLGNNPMVFAVPRSSGNIVLDMAMSQFSYGTLARYAQRGEQLPFPGGYDSSGQLTTDPAAIESTYRALPIGLWKGSGLSLTLDLFAAMLSGGLSSHQLPTEATKETGVSQIFLAIDPTHLAAPISLDAIADAILADLKQAAPETPGRPARYPGEHTLALREENLRLGIPVDPEIWNKLVAGSL